MSNLQINSFTSYDLSDRQILEGSVFSPEQLMVLQNHLADYAEQKISLDFDPKNSEQFLQDEASLKGKIEFLQYLISNSAASIEALQALAENPPND